MLGYCWALGLPMNVVRGVVILSFFFRTWAHNRHYWKQDTAFGLRKKKNKEMAHNLGEE